MLSVVPSVIVLGMAALVAILLARHRPSPPENIAERLAASHALAVATGLQSIHFVEESVTGFHERFPALLGLPSMSFSFFVAFNLIWIAIWITSVSGLRQAKMTTFELRV